MIHGPVPGQLVHRGSRQDLSQLARAYAQSFATSPLGFPFTGAILFLGQVMEL